MIRLNEDRMIACYVRIANRAEYGVPLPTPAPSVDVPESWQWDDTPTPPEAAQNRSGRISARNRAYAIVAALPSPVGVLAGWWLG